jgi:hypothetical protein
LKENPMDYAKIQQVSDIKLDGIRFDVERRDGAITAVTLFDDQGHIVRIVSGNYEALSVLVPAKARTVVAHFVVGSKNGDSIEKRFTDSYAAGVERESLKALGADVKVEAREVVGFQDQE